MTGDAYEIHAEVFQWYARISETASGSAILSQIRERRQASANDEEMNALLSVLAWEFQKQGRFSAAAQILAEQAQLRPDDPLPLISLASQKLGMEDQPAEAREIIGKALLRAQKTGHFQRHALGVSARIALRLGDVAMLNDCLSRIPQITLETGQRDIGKERDFLDAAPQNAVLPDVRNAYEAFLKRA